MYPQFASEQSCSVIKRDTEVHCTDLCREDLNNSYIAVQLNVGLRASKINLGVFANSLWQNLDRVSELSTFLLGTKSNSTSLCLSSIKATVDVLAPLVLEPAGNREYLRVRGRKECMEQKRDKWWKRTGRRAEEEHYKKRRGGGEKELNRKDDCPSITINYFWCLTRRCIK